MVALSPPFNTLWTSFRVQCPTTIQWLILWQFGRLPLWYLLSHCDFDTAALRVKFFRKMRPVDPASFLIRFIKRWTHRPSCLLSRPSSCTCANAVQYPNSDYSFYLSQTVISWSSFFYQGLPSWNSWELRGLPPPLIPIYHQRCTIGVKARIMSNHWLITLLESPFVPA